MSWIITNNRTGEVFEVFDRRIVDRLDRSKVRIEEAAEYLGRINAEIAKGGTNASP